MVNRRPSSSRKILAKKVQDLVQLVLKDSFFLSESEKSVFLVEGTGRAYELSVDTPRVANSYVPSRLVPGRTESRVGSVSHRLQLTLKDRYPVGAWVLELGASSERPLSRVTSLPDFRQLQPT